MFRIRVLLFSSALITGVICVPAHAQLFPQTLRFEIAGSYGAVSPDGISTFLHAVNTFLGQEKFEKIERYGGVEFSVKQSISPRMALFVGAGYLRGSTNKVDAFLTNDYGIVLGKVDEQFRLSSIPLSAGAGYQLDGNAVSVVAEISGEIHIVTFEHHFSPNRSAGIAEHNFTWSGTALGVKGRVSAYWQALSKVFVGIRTGYRITEDVLLIRDEPVSLYDPLIIDFSGFYISLLVGVTPWK